MPTNRRPSPAEERAAREARRLQAAELFAQGHSQVEVARLLGVSRQAVSRWHGRDPKLSASDLVVIEQALLKGAQANGFDTRCGRECW
jgi:transcriptional regulator with XRE-family HTH domain